MQLQRGTAVLTGWDCPSFPHKLHTCRCKRTHNVKVSSLPTHTHTRTHAGARAHTGPDSPSVSPSSAHLAPWCCSQSQQACKKPLCSGSSPHSPLMVRCYCSHPQKSISSLLVVSPPEWNRWDVCASLLPWLYNCSWVIAKPITLENNAPSSEKWLTVV